VRPRPRRPRTSRGSPRWVRRMSSARGLSLRGMMPRRPGARSKSRPRRSLDALGDAGVEVALDDGVAGDLAGLAAEDAGDVGAVLREVVAAAAALGDAGEEVLAGAGADADGGDGDVGVAHVAEQGVDAGLGRLAVAEEDDVLDQGLGADELQVGLAQGGQCIGAAAGAEAADVAGDADAVGGGLEAHEGVGARVEGDHAELVAGVEGAGGGARGLLDEVEAVLAAHRAALVDDEDEREGRLLALALALEAHRQDLLDRRCRPSRRRRRLARRRP
jgi:hypothetical protein